MGKKYVKPGDMTGDQRADWEAMGGAGAHPKGLLIVEQTRNLAPVATPISYADRERLRALSKTMQHDHKEVIELLQKRQCLEKEGKAYTAADKNRARLTAKIERNAARMAKLKMKNIMLSAELKIANMDTNERKAFAAKLRKTRDKGEKATKKMLENHQKTIDLLMLLRASEDDFMRYTGESKHKYVK